VTINSF